MIRLIIFLILIFKVSFSFACLNTYQFKIFPVGLDNENVITIDFQINRTSTLEGNSWYNLGLDSVDEWNEMWILKAYISIYDKGQKLLSTKSFDTAFVIGSNYMDSLQKVYCSGLDSVKERYKSIEFFIPDYISFCDFQQKCNIAKVAYDSINKKDYLIYDKKNYSIEMMRDTAYNFIDRPDYIENISDLFISSIRVYKTIKTKIVIVHLATGHELSMGWITSDPAKVKHTDAETVILAKEHKPLFAFNDLKRGIYEEPLLHHGFGFDAFIVKMVQDN